MIQDFVSQFLDIKIENVIKIGKKYFQTDEEFLSQLPKEARYSGKYLGEETKRGLRPSAILLDMLKDTENYVIIDEKSEWLFLCGRDIFGQSIIKLNKKRGFVLVKNKNNEVLGLANVMGKQEAKIPIKNLFDKGDFLRREK